MIGGTSAGAAVMTRLMISGGRGEARLEQGFDLLQNGKPSFAIGVVIEVRRETIQEEAALGLFPFMTGLTMSREK